MRYLVSADSVRKQRQLSSALITEAQAVLPRPAGRADAGKGPRIHDSSSTPCAVCTSIFPPIYFSLRRNVALAALLIPAAIVGAIVSALSWRFFQAGNTTP